jgi:hypothetical protein
MYLSENQTRQFLIEIFQKFREDYPFLNARPFLISLCNSFGSKIPEDESSKIKYNLCLDVLHKLYGK